METLKAKIEKHIQNLKELQTPGGLFIASAHNVQTGYNKAWLRDNFYTGLAFEKIGDTETVIRHWKAIIKIFNAHKEKLQWAVEHKPHATYQYIHARYNPETFEEFWDEWGNKQNDAIGAILYKIGDLESRGISVLESGDDRDTIQKLVFYLRSIEFWHDPDNGVWEEYEEVHTSSIGACVAGLRQISKLSFISLPENLIENGEQALREILPRESQSKFVDLALLSLLYPYNVLDKEMQDVILTNLEYHLNRERGVIRYKNDRYYNKNSDGYSEEAEWTMGFPWLAIIYALRGDKTKALHYLHKSEQVIFDGKFPELYFSNSSKPNENIPLGWAESLYIVALKECEKFL